jgi:hypothetical protein
MHITSDRSSGKHDQWLGSMTIDIDTDAEPLFVTDSKRVRLGCPVVVILLTTVFLYRLPGYL